MTDETQNTPALKDLDLLLIMAGRGTKEECQEACAAHANVRAALTQSEPVDVGSLKRSVRDSFGNSWTRNELIRCWECIDHLAAQDHLRTQDTTSGVEPIEGLHSKIDMDIEDEIGREITLEESKIIGLALKRYAELTKSGKSDTLEALLEGMRKFVPDEKDWSMRDIVNASRDTGYNQALDDVKDALGKVGDDE